MAARPRLLVAGAGGAAGSAMLAQALGGGRFARITVLTTRRFRHLPAAMAGFVFDANSLRNDGPAPRRDLPAAEVALVHLGANYPGREDVFWQPGRDDLLPLAAQVRACGVRKLWLVISEARDARRDRAVPGPLTRHERQRLEALGFEQLLVCDAASVPVAPGSANPLQRVAGWLINTLLGVVRAPGGVRRGRNPPAAAR